MAAYLIAEIVVDDPDLYEAYKPKAAQSIADFGGRYLARGGDTERLEGGGAPNRMVVVEFPDMATAKAWYHSDQYQEARIIRAPVSRGTLTVVEGIV